MRHIDINCDMGEGTGNEELLMPFISSANIACGFHAGDENEMKRIVALCLEHNVAIGAHPSFPDKENFGRTAMNLSKEEIHEIITAQLNILSDIACLAGAEIHHIKLHGALYNMAAKDILLAKSAAEAVRNFNKKLIYYGLSGSVMVDEAARLGLQIAREVFADRTYQQDGSLTPRPVSNALITDPAQMIRQIMQMINKNQVTAINGENISIKTDTICIHGDGSHAAEFAKVIYDNLTAAGIQIRKIGYQAE